MSTRSFLALLGTLILTASHAQHVSMREYDWEAKPVLADSLRTGAKEDVLTQRHVIAQFADDLVHLEGGGQGLDQYRGLDGAKWQAETALSQHEDTVPQPRFQMAFHLRQIEIGAGALGKRRPGIVKDI